MLKMCQECWEWEDMECYENKCQRCRLEELRVIES